MPKIFVLCVVAIYISVCNAQERFGSQCVLPDNKGYGICKDITQCPRLLNPSVLNNISYVMAHYCGRNNGFCCSDCYTPEGQGGFCTGVDKCPHLNNLPLQYVKNSQCHNKAVPQLCCGPSPTPLRSARCADSLSWMPPDPDSGCCGHDSSSLEGKIIGGNETKIDQYPWIAILEYKVGKKIEIDCGGALISSRYVLTAAHCLFGRLRPYIYGVRLGEFNTTNTNEDCNEEGDCADLPVSIPIEKVIIHPEYNNETKKDDIALLRLSEEARYTDFVRPICLPLTDIPENGMLSSHKVYAAGWGKVSGERPRSDTKQHVKLPLVNMKSCGLAYKGTKYTIWNKQICAGGEPGKDSCSGDSGGPLMLDNAEKKVYELIGVISYGPKTCGTANVPGVYTKVIEYNTWIRSNMEP